MEIKDIQLLGKLREIDYETFRIYLKQLANKENKLQRKR